MDRISIFVETKGDDVKKPSLELLSEGRKLAATGRFEVQAVALGPLSEAAAEKLLSFGMTVVHMADPLLDAYTAEGYAEALAAYAAQAKPKMILAGATRLGRDFLPRVAVLLGCGMVSDATAASWLDEPVTFVRPVYGGKVLTEVSPAAYPVVVTTRPNTFGIADPEGPAGRIEERQAALSPSKVHTKVLRVEKRQKGKVDLTEADIIVSGGRGLKSAENFRIIEELAEVMGATVGASRSVVDAGWRDQEDQVGKSGKTVSPKLYIAVGISGAIHHIMGMDTSKVVLAINKDPNAIIFQYASYGVVADLFEVVPAMTAELKRRLGR